MTLTTLQSRWVFCIYFVPHCFDSCDYVANAVFQVRKKYGIEVAVTDEELSVIAEQNLEMMEQRLKQATEAQSV